jgi:hypothetical protein
MDDSSAVAHTVAAWLLCTLGRHEEARDACSRAIAIEPLSFAANLQLALCLYAERQLDRAVEQCWKVLTLAPQFAPAQIVLGMAYERLGMYEDAMVEFQNARCCGTFEPAAIAGMCHVYSVMHLEREAEDICEELSHLAWSRYVSPYWFAVVSAVRGDRHRSLSHLDECVRERDPNLLLLAVDPRFDDLRQCERFRGVTATLSSEVRQLARTAAHY